MEHGNRMKLNNIRHSCISSGCDTCTTILVYSAMGMANAIMLQLPYAHSDHKFCSISSPHQSHIVILCVLFSCLFGRPFSFTLYQSRPIPMASIRNIVAFVYVCVCVNVDMWQTKLNSASSALVSSHVALYADIYLYFEDLFLSFSLPFGCV